MRRSAKRARKRATHMLQDLGFSDQEIVEVDSGRSASSGHRWDLAATAAALYVAHPRTHVAHRFAYDDLSAVWIDHTENGRGHYPGNLEFVDREVGRFAFTEVTLSNGALPRLIETECARRGAATSE